MFIIIGLDKRKTFYVANLYSVGKKGASTVATRNQLLDVSFPNSFMDVRNRF